MTRLHLRIHALLISLLTCASTVLVLCCILVRPSAAEPFETSRRHSLIQRQPVDSRSTETSAVTSAPVTTVAPATRPPRKLTKRPAQIPVGGPSSESATSQATGLVQPPVSRIEPNRTSGDNRISKPGVAAPGSSTPATGPISSVGTATSNSTINLASATGKTAMANALPGTGAAPTTSSGSGSAVGRGLQRLTAQVPGLTQLVAPTVSVSSSPPSPAPSPGTTQSPSPSSPSSLSPLAPPATVPATGSATLSWTLNTETDLAGYKIYVGTASGVYRYPGSPFTVGLIGSYTIAGLPAGQTYYFAISAFDSFGGESGLSSEVSKSIY